jgi:hypothetical protein
MSDMTDFNDAQGVGLASDIDAIQAEEKTRAKAVQEENEARESGAGS